MTTTALTSEALALPLRERVEFAQLIWASIDEQLADAGVAEALMEAQSRDAALDADLSIGQSHEEVMRLARHALK